MATEKRLIDVSKPIEETESIIHFRMCNLMPTEDYESFLNYLKKQPTVDAVEVERLGKLGRLMVPYKGCPRGRRGTRGFAPNTTPEEILEEVVKDVYNMGVITDVEGDQWIPVIKEDLEFLIRGCRKSVGDSHGPEGARNDRQDGSVVHGDWIDGRPYVNSRWKVCSVCHQSAPEPHGGYNYCPNCGARMDQEVDYGDR